MHAAIEPGVSVAQRRHLTVAHWLARTLDARWHLGPLHFGVETLLDLVPGVGDATSIAVSAYQLLLAFSLSLPYTKLARMVVYVVVDLLLGLVPFFGDLADLVFKVHLRNQRIIEGYLATRFAS